VLFMKEDHGCIQQPQDSRGHPAIEA